MRKPTHLVKTILACYYQEIATGKDYPTDDDMRRRAAITQFNKKESLGTIDLEIFNKALERYLKEQAEEIKNFNQKLKHQKMYTTKFGIESEQDGVIVESAYLLDDKQEKALDTIYATTEDGKTSYHSHSGKTYEWNNLSEINSRDHCKFFH